MWDRVETVSNAMEVFLRSVFPPLPAVTSFCFGGFGLVKRSSVGIGVQMASPRPGFFLSLSLCRKLEHSTPLNLLDLVSSPRGDISFVTPAPPCETETLHITDLQRCFSNTIKIVVFRISTKTGVFLNH